MGEVGVKAKRACHINLRDDPKGFAIHFPGEFAIHSLGQLSEPCLAPHLALFLSTPS